MQETRMSMMSRLLVFGLVVSLGHASAASAGDTVLTSATRMVRNLADTSSPPAVGALRRAPLAQQDQPGLASTGLRKRTKVAIALAIAATFAAVAHTIDGRVENTTPSSLGTRQDK
jgi:hypothetical protein